MGRGPIRHVPAKSDPFRRSLAHFAFVDEDQTHVSMGSMEALQYEEERRKRIEANRNRLGALQPTRNWNAYERNERGRERRWLTRKHPSKRKRWRSQTEQLGVMKQKTLMEMSTRIRKPILRREKNKVEVKRDPVLLRSSKRLRGTTPEYEGVEEEPVLETGRIVLPSVERVGANVSELLARRCDSKGRGSVYDQKVGICCHFCRQKKLCGEIGCPRCEERDDSKECIGKSECSRCHSATGRFCRACLLIRYGLELEHVRNKADWLCPHCHEEEFPEEGWICNSSICMTRRGLAPTGIAIFEAQKRGFPSVAHFVQARLLKYNEGRGHGPAECKEFMNGHLEGPIPKKKSRMSEAEKLQSDLAMGTVSAGTRRQGRVLRSASK